jgi:MFS family permease
MYPSVRDRPSATGAVTAAPPGTRRLRLPGIVVLLGLTSLFTDVSSEMITAVLPLYLTVQLALTPLEFAGLEALGQGVQALLRIRTGRVADRRRRHREIALAGYGLSAASRLAMLATTRGGIGLVTGVTMVDRFGKGIRTSPRDAMIATATPPAILGRAFGVHRAFDTVGAVAGPVVAFAVLDLVPDAYDTVFLVSFAFALVGVAILALLVRPDPVPGPGPGLPAGTPAGTLAVAAAADWSPDDRGPEPPAATVSDLWGLPSVRRLTIVAAVLGAATVSDSMLYLVYRDESSIDLKYFPLLFTGTAVAYLLLAIPFGWLADRVGRAVVFVTGYLALAAAYGTLLLAHHGSTTGLALVALLGTYYAATDGVLSALTSAAVPDGSRTTGLALVSTGVVATRFVAALAFGLVWTELGPDRAVQLFIIGLVLAIAAAWRILVVPERAARRRAPTSPVPPEGRP